MSQLHGGGTHGCNARTQDAVSGRSLWAWGQAVLQNEFQDNQGYTEKYSLDKSKGEKKRKKKKSFRKKKQTKKPNIFYLHKHKNKLHQSL